MISVKRILYTFNRVYFNKYKQEREEKNVNIITFALIELNANNLMSVLDFDEVDINITSVVQALNHSGDSYLFEKLLYALDEFENINYIIDEKYSSVALELVGTIFSETKSITSKYDNSEKSGVNKRSAKVKTLVNIRKDKMQRLKEHLKSSLIGHAVFQQDLLKAITSFRFFNKKIKDHPILSVFLVGGSGLGKTEVARALDKFLDGRESSPLAKINFANYKSEASLASLIGSPPGYVDSGTESDFVKKIRNSNTGVLLVDEFEKADPTVHNFFLQLLEEGKFDDAMGEVHDLNGYIIIFTSNLTPEQYTNTLPPELKSRFDLVMHFENLTLEEKKLFSYKTLKNYVDKARITLPESDIQMLIDDLTLDKENNLRNIKREIRESFFEYVSMKK